MRDLRLRGPGKAGFGCGTGTSNIFDAAAGRRFHGREQAFAVHPERMLVHWRTAGTAASPPGGPILSGTVTALAYVGRATQVRVQPEDGPAVVVLADLPAETELLGSTVDVTWPESAVAWLPGG
ncbi:TOBE domain-containing protein [Arthrobacter ginkgonis]|uniref:TOBE domain-containing protein n=1 Tax=Arthrobacter ginkgonis TaxID=1630594 RepID=UPI0031E88AA0